jgi:alkanesulfonate monooxygenase SsuD/methylene tetrahydromethanopterin reductase-like flavin-dependent oxidoreductase (luciferase family)
MPEHFRSIVTRLRAYVADRRRSPRVRLRLPCAVSLYESDDEGARRNAQLAGFTRDISASGLALILPAVRVGERYLTGAGVTLRVRLEHSTGALELLATPVHYDQLGGEESDKGFLVGVRIVAMDDADRARYEAHLKESN